MIITKEVPCCWPCTVDVCVAGRVVYASPPVAEVEADVDRLDNVDRGWVDIRRLLAIDADTALAFV